ncbi:acyl-ACP--UDP-N-acetylglucosamine O-acyltransferase [Sedimenticola sp.]|uniref:acyl-ACP--UDP-N-acetylglucosamine O-acyltransferase n=1 Tax=Sedimenticola sp. TaxID=1940285 RepID=UPI003D130F2A
MSNIHPTAIVDKNAELGDNVKIGPYAVIGAGVKLGEGTTVGAHAVIEGPTIVGKFNKIHPFVALGGAPQDLTYTGEKTTLEIGDRNVIREYATMNRGTPRGSGTTRIGNDNFFMSYSHVAHDCDIGSHVVLVNCANLAGHVKIDDWVTLAGFSKIHQFCRIGKHAFTGMGCGVAKDVPPYMMAFGNPAEPAGLNKVGLKRRGFTDEQLQLLRQAYKLLYKSKLKLSEALERLQEMARESQDVAELVTFVEASKRSIIR